MKRLLTILMLVFVAACSAPDHGTVYDKKYYEAYITTDWNCVSYDKKGFCNLRIPTVHHWPEHWELCLRLGEDEGCRTVDQITFHEYAIGSEYP
jgi:hypothetical protein